MSAVLALVGGGVVGQRIALRADRLGLPVELRQVDPRRGELPACDAVVIVSPEPHLELAAEAIGRGMHVVTVGDDLDDLRALLDLNDDAVAAGAALVVGAGMSPGLVGLLARRLADRLVVADEIHVATHGTAGPACARQHHRALSGRAVGYHDGGWIVRPAGSGRELCWFPEPVGAYDCYRSSRGTTLALHAAFPDATRLSARNSANRRDRLTAWLPMLSPPHREGGVGAIRVEVRGRDADGGRVTAVAGIAELVGTAAAATAAAAVAAVLRDEVPAGAWTLGDERLDTAGLLGEVARLGVRLQEFTGIPHPVSATG